MQSVCLTLFCVNIKCNAQLLTFPDDDDDDDDDTFVSVKTVIAVYNH